MCTDKSKTWVGASIRLSATGYYVNREKVATPDEYIKAMQKAMQEDVNN